MSENRKVLLQAALEVFRENGYERTTVRGIADRAGIPLSTLYAHIESKEKLFLELVQPVIDRPLATMREITESDMTTLEKLRAAIVRAAAPYDEYFPELFMYFNDFYPALDRVEPGPRQEYEQHWLTIITDGIEEGVIRSDIDPLLVMYGTLGMIAWMHKWYSGHEGHTATQIGEQYADMVIDGLTTRAR